MENQFIALKDKYIINFDIKCKTGLHIGGNNSGSGIGDVDMPVLRDPITRHPYICGSSLKGRMRERLEWLHGNINEQVKDIKKKREKIEEETKKELGGKYSPDELVKRVEQKIHNEILAIGQCKCGICEICHYFGHSSQEEDVILGPTRFIVRDAMPKQEENGYDQIKIWDELLGNAVNTEFKIENTISRLTATAVPRTLERVPAGSIFTGEIVIDLYETPSIEEYQDIAGNAMKLLLQGMVAVESSYMGGSGSRGSGRIAFKNFKIKHIPTSYFTTPPKESIKPELFGEDITATELWQKKIFEQFN